jgi:hypothetical protein
VGIIGGILCGKLAVTEHLAQELADVPLVVHRL